MTAPSRHPEWCSQAHETRVHRGRVGDAQVDGHTVTIGILQVGDEPPSVTLAGAGAGVVEVNPDDDHEDMARLLELCGRHTLAALVRRGATILREMAR
jgi:hypothetical protein